MGLFDCCKDCKDRYVGCHAVCEKYIEAKVKRNEFNKKVKKMYEIDRITHRKEGT